MAKTHGVLEQPGTESPEPGEGESPRAKRKDFFFLPCIHQGVSLQFLPPGGALATLEQVLTAKSFWAKLVSMSIFCW